MTQNKAALGVQICITIAFLSVGGLFLSGWFGLVTLAAAIGAFEFGCFHNNGHFLGLRKPNPVEPTFEPMHDHNVREGLEMLAENGRLVCVRRTRWLNDA
jgi:hypothetical protein